MCAAKGQLILKFPFSVFKSSKKLEDATFIGHFFYEYFSIRTKKLHGVKAKKISKKFGKYFILGENRLQTYSEISLQYTEGLIQSSLVGYLLLAKPIRLQRLLIFYF